MTTQPAGWTKFKDRHPPKDVAILVTWDGSWTKGYAEGKTLYLSDALGNLSFPLAAMADRYWFKPPLPPIWTPA